MIRIILISLTLFVWHASGAQDIGNVEFVKGKCFEGYIFPKENTTDSNWMPFGNVDRYTPTTEDIFKVEQALKDQLKDLNKQVLMNQGNGCPFIHKKLGKYKRQYFGYINDAGEKVVWVNLMWNKEKELLKPWGKKLIVVLDGCSHYWNVKVNLKEGKLF